MAWLFLRSCYGLVLIGSFREGTWRCFHRLLLILIACLAVGLALAGAPARAAQFYIEDLRIPIAEAGPQGLEAFLVRPAGTKRYPLALLSHGSPRSFDDRATMSAPKYCGIALEYARRGFAALIVMRRGYGQQPLRLLTYAPRSMRWRAGPTSRRQA